MQILCQGTRKPCRSDNVLTAHLKNTCWSAVVKQSLTQTLRQPMAIVHHDHHDNQANLNRPGSASWSQTVHWHLRGPFGKHQSYRNSVSSPCDLQTDQDNLKLSRHFMINTTNTHKKSLQACTQPRQYRQYCKLKVQLQRKHEKIMLARIDPFQQPRLQRCRSRAHIFSSWTVHHLSSRHSRHTLFVWQRMTTNTHH